MSDRFRTPPRNRSHASSQRDAGALSLGAQIVGVIQGQRSPALLQLVTGSLGALFVAGCGASLGEATRLAEIESPRFVAASSDSPPPAGPGLVTTLDSPTFSDLTASPQDSSRPMVAASKRTFQWSVDSDFKLASSIEALKNRKSSEIQDGPAIRLVQNPVAPPGSPGGPLPEMIPTPKGEPDPNWIGESPAEPMEAPMDASDGSPTPKPVLQPKTEASSSAAAASGNDPDSAMGALRKSPESIMESAEAERGLKPEDYKSWDTPTVAIVFTGNQHGYIEPCGCTGLERQKGGVARRFTFFESLGEMGWTVVPMDVGNQVRRYGDQAKIKLQQSVRALSEMNYQAIGFGPEDIRLGVGELLSVAGGDSPEEQLHVSANVVLFDPEFMPQQKILESNGLRIGVTSILDPASLETEPSEELLVNEMVRSLKASAEKLKAESPDYNVLLFYGEEKSAMSLVRDVDGFDLVVVSGGYGEPTYQANGIEGSQTKIIVTGNKGMYAGVVGLFKDDQAASKHPAMRYARVPLTHEFGDAPAMRVLMKDYQNQLRDVGLQGLGLLPPIPHPSGNQFIGAQACGKCHTEAFDIWEGSAHSHATDSIIEPPEDRGDVARHFDPECISCHVTGWNAQSYYPYQSGYLSLESTGHLTGNGCENCHGPGAEHAAAEEENSGVSQSLRDQLRQAMQLPLDQAKEKCMSCHDLDNSPDFHEPDAFEDIYWPEVEHYGME